MDTFETSQAHNYALDDVRFDVKVTTLPRGTFDNYTAWRRSEGADVAHLKPPMLIHPRKYYLCCWVNRPRRPNRRQNLFASLFRYR